MRLTRGFDHRRLTICSHFHPAMWDEWKRGVSERAARRLYRANKPDPRAVDRNGYRIHHVAVLHDNPELLRLLMAEPDGVRHAVHAKYTGSNLSFAGIYCGMVAIVMAVVSNNIEALELLYPHAERGQKFFWEAGSKKLSLISIAVRLGAAAAASWIEEREGSEFLDPDSAVLRAVRLNAGDTKDVRPFSEAMGPTILRVALFNPRTPRALIRALVVRHRIPIDHSSVIFWKLIRRGQSSLVLDLFEWGYRPKNKNRLLRDLVVATIPDADRLALFRKLISLGYRPQSDSETITVFMAPSLYLEACHRRPKWIKDIPNAVTRMAFYSKESPEVCARIRTVIELCDVNPNGSDKEALYAVVSEGYVETTRMLLSLSRTDLSPRHDYQYQPPWAVLPPHLFNAEFHNRHFECVVMVLEAMRAAGYQVPASSHPVHRMMRMERTPYHHINALLDKGLVPQAVDIDSALVLLAKPGWSDYEVSVLIKYFGSVRCARPDTYEVAEVHKRVFALNFVFIPRGVYWVLDLINEVPARDPLSAMLFMAHTWGPMLFMATMQPGALVNMFRNNAHLPPNDSCLCHPDGPPSCCRALALRRDVVKASGLGWSRGRHYLYDPEFRERVVQLTMVANRLSASTALPPLPLEMWYHALSFCGR